MSILYLHQNGAVLGDASSDGGISLGGICPFAGAMSPNNGLPLTQLAVVELDAIGLDSSGWRVAKISFLYSWKCGIFEGDFSYRIIDGAVDILEHASGNPDVEDFPYPDFQIVFPAKSYQARSLTQDERD